MLISGLHQDFAQAVDGAIGKLLHRCLGFAQLLRDFAAGAFVAEPEDNHLPLDIGQLRDR
jgi:predicted methyltransferase MtxX (methanogen marker protein 4)